MYPALTPVFAPIPVLARLAALALTLALAAWLAFGAALAPAAAAAACPDEIAAAQGAESGDAQEDGEGDAAPDDHADETILPGRLDARAQPARVLARMPSPGRPAAPPGHGLDRPPRIAPLASGSGRIAAV